MQRPNVQFLHQQILDLRSKDTDKRKAATAYIPAICSALGQRRTVEEFVTYITETTGNTEEQWINVLCNLGRVDFSRYNERMFGAFLSGVRVLSELDSKRTRTAFVSTVCQACLSVDASVRDAVIPPFLKKMVEDEWWPVQATGFAILAKVSYPKEGVVELFTVEDGSFVVRKEMVNAACSVVVAIGEEDIEALFEVMEKFAGDESVSVVCEVPRFLVKYVERTGDLDKAVGIGATLMKNENWRVRCAWILSLSSLFDKVRDKCEKMVDSMIAALKDDMEEVRTAVAEQMAFLATVDISGYEDKVKQLISVLVTAKGQHTRASIANCLPEFGEKLDIDLIAGYLIDFVADSSREVKLAAIESITRSQIPLATAIDCLTTLAKSTKEWREKVDIADVIPIMVTDDVDGSLFTGLIRMLLLDDSFDVRMGMIKKLPELANSFGEDWKQKAIIPILNDAINDEDYIMRQMAIHAIAEFATYSPAELAIINKAVDDKVSNVRFVVAKYLPRSYKDILTKLRNDPDEDVRDIARL